MPFEETLSDAIAIYSTLRVPRHLVPAKVQGTFSNVDASMKAFYDDVIIPLATMFAETWTVNMCFAEQRKYVVPSYDHIDLLQENKKLKAEVNKITTETAALQYEKGMITKNQRNSMVGAQVLPDGDKYASDPENQGAMIERLGIGGTQALQSILADSTMSEEAKAEALVVIFGMKESDAKKLVKPKETNPDTNINPKDNVKTDNITE